MDKYGNFLKDLDDDFNLYKIIAKNVVSAVPKDQINKIIFKEFIIDSKDLPSSEFVYTYWFNIKYVVDSKIPSWRLLFNVYKTKNNKITFITILDSILSL